MGLEKHGGGFGVEVLGDGYVADGVGEFRGSDVEAVVGGRLEESYADGWVKGLDLVVIPGHVAHYPRRGEE